MAALQALVGMALPAIKSQGGYFAAKDQFDTAWGDIIIAIMCPKGARWGNRAYGSDVTQYLFDPADAATVAVLKQAIATTVKKYCPQVNLLGVQVDVSAKTVHLRISYSLVTDSTVTKTQLLQVNRPSAIQFLSGASV